MAIENDLSRYPHPYVTVDGVLFRFKDGKLGVKLIQQPKLEGKWSLPGSFVHVDRLAVDTLRETMKDKAGEEGFYAEQLQTYDALNRDERGRIISIAYLCLTNDRVGTKGWFSIEDGEELKMWDTTIHLDDLAFDHGQIIRDARERLANKLWYSDLPKYLLPETFRVSEVQALYELLEGAKYYHNFRRNIGGCLEEVGTEAKATTRGPRAKMFKWAGYQQKGV